MEKTPCSRFCIILFSASAILLIILALIIKKGDDVFFINGNNSVVLDNMFSLITTMGEGLLFIPLTLWLLFIQFRYAIVSALVCGGHAALCAFIKRGLFSHIGRPTSVLDNTALHFVPGINLHTHYSFPSGHTATIFCLALLMALVLKKKTPAVILLLVALMVGYSRIYLLQHFLTDVAGGAVIGIGFTWLIWEVFNLNTMPRWMNNSLTLNRGFFDVKDRKEIDA